MSQVSDDTDYGETAEVKGARSGAISV